MKLYFFDDARGNFGDHLNPWLWSRLCPDLFDGRSHELFVGIGTLLNDTMPVQAHKFIFGAGVGYRGAPLVDDRWTFLAVRGPHSAASLDLDPAMAITDPACLVPLVWTPTPRPSSPTPRIGFMPHLTSAVAYPWAALCAQAGLRYISPIDQPIATTLEQIAECDQLITEALHGAIVADALGIPWRAVATRRAVLPSKWVDWCASMAVPYEPRPLPSLIDLSDLTAAQRFQRWRWTVQRWLQGRPTQDFAWRSTGPVEQAQALTALNEAKADRFLLSDRALLASKQTEFLRRLGAFAATRGATVAIAVADDSAASA